MLQFLRSHQRLALAIVLIFIIPSFVLVGVEGYTRFTDGDAVAKVAGQKISQQEWDESIREQANRLQNRYGSIDRKMFESPEFKNNVLENMIVERAIYAHAASHHLLAPDTVLQQAIINIPGLTKADGSFDKERYKRFLDAQGMTPEMFQEKLRLEMTFQRIRNAVQSSYFIPLTVADRISDLAAQEREVQQLPFNAAQFLGKARVTEDMIAAFYKQHAALFEVPEKMKIEYVVLKADDVAADITVKEADIKAFYEQNASRYALPEARRASHILVALKKEASEAEKTTARKKAEALLAQVRAKPGDFGKYAKANSDDPGSAQRAGDLGFFSKDKMVKPFADAAFALKKGEISDLVQSDFGYHIIKLTDIKGATTRKLGEVKQEIADMLKRQMVAKRFGEMVEVFSNTVGAKALYNHAAFLKAMFSDETIKNKHNSEAVQVAPNVMMAGRVVEYKPATVRPLAQVKSAIQHRLTLQEATQLAKKEGEAKLRKLQTGEKVNGFGGMTVLSHAKSQGVHPLALAAVMKADTRKLPVYVGVEIPQQGYVIYRVTKVRQPTMEKGMRAAERQQLTGIMSQQEMADYIEALKRKAKAEILKPAKAAESQGSA
jgi:peptidyl-prolyl cis-trans isomerase D